MDARMIGLQHFGAGDVVNYAGDTNRANAGSYNVNLNEPVSTGDLATAVKEYYNRVLLELAGPKLVHAQFGQKGRIPKGGGRTCEWRRFSSLPKALTPLTEGVTPTGNKLIQNNLTAFVDQFGDYIETTDIIETVTIDNIKDAAAEALSDQAGRTLDTVVRNELLKGTNVFYVPRLSGGTEYEVTSRADITADSRPRIVDIFRAANLLNRVNGQKIDGSYVCIIHPDVETDIMMQAGNAWINVNQYAHADKIFDGEIGKIGGVRFVVSTEAKIIGPSVIQNGLSRLTVDGNMAESSTSVVVKESGLSNASFSTAVPVYVGGSTNTITAISVNADTGVATLTLGSAVQKTDGTVICGKNAGKDGSAVYCCLLIAKDAYGTVDLEGLGLEFIAKPKGYGNDPLNQRASTGWKATQTAKILADEYLVRIECGSYMSHIAESN